MTLLLKERPWVMSQLVKIAKNGRNVAVTKIFWDDNAVEQADNADCTNFRGQNDIDNQIQVSLFA